MVTLLSYRSSLQGNHVCVDRLECELVVTQTTDPDGVIRLSLAGQPRPGRVAVVDGHLATILGDDEVQAEARDASIHQQFFAAGDGLRGVSGDLDQDTPTAFDYWVIISVIAHHPAM